LYPSTSQREQKMGTISKETMNCPNGHGNMSIIKSDRTIKFRGKHITFPINHYICPVCGIEAGSIEQTAATQRAISDAFRKASGLLTGEEIREGRKRLGLTQETFAKKMNVGIASIKRWEGGLIQTKSMDKFLRTALRGSQPGDNYTGNRQFSIQRTKLVLRQFESALNRMLLKKNDKMLYASKYLWYADMVAFRELGEGMTGSTYAALPMGPQLDNYRDLIDEIKTANETDAEPLTPEEKKIVTRVAHAFPRNALVYSAAHKERIFTRKKTGDRLLYSDSSELTEI
jgi:putative zinc finger/helix-turn-helix YgiT family protein